MMFYYDGMVSGSRRARFCRPARRRRARVCLRADPASVPRAVPRAQVPERVRVSPRERVSERVRVLPRERVSERVRVWERVRQRDEAAVERDGGAGRRFWGQACDRQGER